MICIRSLTTWALLIVIGALSGTYSAVRFRSTSLSCFRHWVSQWRKQVPKRSATRNGSRQTEYDWGYLGVICKINDIWLPLLLQMSWCRQKSSCSQNIAARHSNRRCRLYFILIIEGYSKFTGLVFWLGTLYTTELCLASVFKGTTELFFHPNDYFNKIIFITCNFCNVFNLQKYIPGFIPSAFHSNS